MSFPVHENIANESLAPFYVRIGLERSLISQPGLVHLEDSKMEGGGGG